MGMVSSTYQELKTEDQDGMAVALATCLALAVSRQVDYNSSLCNWHLTGEKVNHTFARQALPMVWDYVEVYPFSGSTGDFGGAVEWVSQVCESNSTLPQAGYVELASATAHPSPDNAADAFVTDPPYYDAVPYAYLSDYFYVWLRRGLSQVQPDLFRSRQVPKDEEIVVDRPHELSKSKKGVAFYERELTKAFAEGRRILRPGGIGTIVFASKTTASWEAILKAVVDAGWVITGSWPIDTEMESRVAAQGQARLGSSIHLVCRPRADSYAAAKSGVAGDWRDIIQELPTRIHEWMPRLATEGIVGADAIFACLGPALEIFSRHTRVERASGEQVTLGEYLVQVWAAVAKEALSIVLGDADTLGLEEDARLTAMWLWTLSTGSANGADSTSDNGDEGAAHDDEEASGSKKATTSGYVLEFDAARKIAQGLGAHLENLIQVVSVQGEYARLLSIAERAPYLFGKDTAQPTLPKRRPAAQQLDMFAELVGPAEAAPPSPLGAPPPGKTVLDRVHQAMILFGSGRAEALKRYLVEDGAGSDSAFWRLAQSLSALYPSGSDEKRWVDGVLARKKSLGF